MPLLSSSLRVSSIVPSSLRTRPCPHPKVIAAKRERGTLRKDGSHEASCLAGERERGPPGTPRAITSYAGPPEKKVVLPASVWVEVKAAAVEVDRRLEV